MSTYKLIFKIVLRFIIDPTQNLGKNERKNFRTKSVGIYSEFFKNLCVYRSETLNRISTRINEMIFKDLAILFGSDTRKYGKLRNILEFLCVLSFGFLYKHMRDSKIIL